MLSTAATKDYADVIHFQGHCRRQTTLGGTCPLPPGNSPFAQPYIPRSILILPGPTFQSLVKYNALFRDSTLVFFS